MHDPSEIPLQLGAKLSARSRHICIFLGAGASRAAGLPDLAGLQEEVLNALDDDDRPIVQDLFSRGNLETALSYIRRLASILDDGEDLRGITGPQAKELQDRITQAIIPALDTDSANVEPFGFLAAWIAGGSYQHPVEIFTINYDLLIERGFEDAGVPYFDGFVGNLRARFHPELVDDLNPESRESLPPNFVRLWKLHGSVNWAELEEADVKRIVRQGRPVGTDSVAAIYPSDEKYDQSRRVPFVVLLDRFREALRMPETVTIISGYSFGDQHLNEMIFDAARNHPRSEIIVFCYTDILDPVVAPAISMRNITVLAESEAIIGGERLGWHCPDEVPGVWESGKFLLGDFANLARLVSRQATEVRSAT